MKLLIDNKVKSFLFYFLQKPKPVPCVGGVSSAPLAAGPVLWGHAHLHGAKPRPPTSSGSKSELLFLLEPTGNQTDQSERWAVNLCSTVYYYVFLVLMSTTMFHCGLLYLAKCFCWTQVCWGRSLSSLPLSSCWLHHPTNQRLRKTPTNNYIIILIPLYDITVSCFQIQFDSKQWRN